MDRGSVKEGDMDPRSEPTLPSEELSLCQYSGLTRSRAYELFPIEESEKDLAAVRKRMAAGGGFKLLTK
jgi:hypothetical protein